MRYINVWEIQSMHIHTCDFSILMQPFKRCLNIYKLGCGVQLTFCRPSSDLNSISKSIVPSTLVYPASTPVTFTLLRLKFWIFFSSIKVVSLRIVTVPTTEVALMLAVVLAWSSSISYSRNTSAWQSHDNHMTVTWQSHDSHMTITWQSHGNHMTDTWVSHYGCTAPSCAGTNLRMWSATI